MLEIGRKDVKLKGVRGNVVKSTRFNFSFAFFLVSKPDVNKLEFVTDNVFEY